MSKIEKSEQTVWELLVRMRNRVKQMILSGDDFSDKVNMESRLSDIFKLEDHILWLWKRLEMDMIKGDPCLFLSLSDDFSDLENEEQFAQNDSSDE